MKTKNIFAFIVAMSLTVLNIPISSASADDIIFSNIVSVSGVLRTADGDSVSGVNICLYDGVTNVNACARTDADGSYVVGIESQALQAEHLFNVYSYGSGGSQSLPTNDWLVIWKPLTLRANQNVFSLPRTKILNLHLEDTLGNPIIDGSVSKYAYESFKCHYGSSPNCGGSSTHSFAEWSPEGQGRGDKDGNISLVTFGYGGEARIYGKTIDGFSATKTVTLSADQSQTFIFPAIIPVSGVLRTADGDSVSGVNICLYDGVTNVNACARTDADGSYVVGIESQALQAEHLFNVYSYGSGGSQSLPTNDWMVHWKPLTLRANQNVFSLPRTKILNLHLEDTLGNPIIDGSVSKYAYESFKCHYGSSPNCGGSSTHSFAEWSPEGQGRGDKDGNISLVTFGYGGEARIYGKTKDGFSVAKTMTLEGRDFLNVPEPVVSGVADIGSVLSVDQGSWGTDVSYNYQWLRDGSAIAGATSATYRLTPEDNLHAVSVKVTGSSSGYYSATKTSSVLRVSSSVSVSAPVVSGDAVTGGVLSSHSSSWGQDVSVAIQWLRDGKAIAGANSSSYRVQRADLSHRLTVQETATKAGFASLKVVSDSTVLVANRFSKLISPVVTGKPTVGYLLSTAVTPFGAGTTYSYQWLRNGVAIEGAVDRKYEVKVTDLNSAITFRVCGSKQMFETVCLVSNSSVVALGELNRKPNVVLKWTSLKTGSVISVKTSSWDAGVSLAYSWLRDGVEITNEVQNSYRLTAADRGHTIAFKVVARKLGYNEVIRTSIAKLIP